MKICTNCQETKPYDAFNKRTASKDGLSPICKPCNKALKQVAYWANPDARREHIERTVRNKQARFEQNPAYRRAFNLWGTTKKRTKGVPQWVAIVDFVPLCQKAINKGPEYVLDHVIPLNHPLVCGLHVPANIQVVHKDKNLAKGSSFRVGKNF